MGGLFDFRVTPNPNLCWMFNLDVEFDNYIIVDKILGKFTLVNQLGIPLPHPTPPDTIPTRVSLFCSWVLRGPPLSPLHDPVNVPLSSCIPNSLQHVTLTLFSATMDKYDT